MYGKVVQDFGWLNAEIGQKMANGHLLFLALICMYVLMHSCGLKTRSNQPGHPSHIFCASTRSGLDYRIKQ